MTVAATRFIPAPDQGSAKVVVLAAELFPEAVVVVLATTIWDEVAAAGIFDPREHALAIEDDLGTDYRRVLSLGLHSNWGSSHGVNRANPSFEPAVPAEAGYLRVRLGRWGSVKVTL